MLHMTSNIWSTNLLEILEKLKKGTQIFNLILQFIFSLLYIHCSDQQLVRDFRDIVKYLFLYVILNLVKSLLSQIFHFRLRRETAHLAGISIK